MLTSEGVDIQINRLLTENSKQTGQRGEFWLSEYSEDRKRPVEGLFLLSLTTHTEASSAS